MKFAVIGLGSMGKRRIRCLHALGYEDLVGFDVRDDRRRETEQRHSIPTVGKLQAIDPKDLDAVIISTPPDHHLEYIAYALTHNIPSFVEASVIVRGLDLVSTISKSKKCLVAPSCTMRFHEGIKAIKNIVAGGTFGNVTNFTYHCGQYLPDWHPWERVKDFYVSQQKTGGAREIVPFELTWLIDVIGFPLQAKGFKIQTMNIGADIDDSYSIALKFKKCVGTMVIDVASRFATRSLILNMEQGQLRWNWEEPFFSIYDARAKSWTKRHYKQGKAHRNYNKNISEQMYIDEVSAFVNAVKGKMRFPNTLDNDIEILKILQRIENSDK